MGPFRRWRPPADVTPCALPAGMATRIPGVFPHRGPPVARPIIRRGLRAVALALVIFHGRPVHQKRVAPDLGRDASSCPTPVEYRLAVHSMAKI
eukprot:11167841-Lingulodinium_polyedra.AAC.1